MNETQSRKMFMDGLISEGLFIPTGIQGFFGRGAVFEDIVHRFSLLIDEQSEQDGAEKISFPPLVPRSTIERAGYLESMPHLCGVVHSFCGGEEEQRGLVERAKDGGDWSDFLEMTDLALAPAACYPLYPTCTGQLPEGGRLVDLTSAAYVFRREPSDDPARLQAFRMRELVRISEPDQVQDWRELWLERGRTLLSDLGLEVQIDEASDPFFGRGGRMMAANQRQQKLKFEISVAICSEEHPTAISSFNYHREHFGSTFDINTHSGDCAHTACLGFGLERIALALLKTHGFDPRDWPSKVRNQLWP